MIIRAQSSLVVEDVVQLNAEDGTRLAYYEVKGFVAMGGSQFKRVLLDKISKPTFPNAEEEEGGS